jgi:hypothetical protein
MSRYTPFIKTAGRGSAYCTRGGGCWIIRTGRSWHLLRMARPTEGVERETLGMFPTLGDAVTHYRRDIARTIYPTAVAE